MISFQKAIDNTAYASVNLTGQNTSTADADAEQSTEYQSAIASSLSDIYNQPSISDTVISDSEENEVHYIVCLEPTDIEMILVVSDVSMREKDVINGRYKRFRQIQNFWSIFVLQILFLFRTKTRWNLKSLESCDRIKSDVLRLNFDTIKKDKKERIYRVEEGLCQVSFVDYSSNHTFPTSSFFDKIFYSKILH